MKTLVAIAFALCLVSITAAPVIGLLSIPSKVTGHPAANYSYVPASYVKLIESAGAQVVPIPYDATEDQVNFLLNQVNGVFFIGGGADLYEKDANGKPIQSNLSSTGWRIVNHVLNAKDNFPLMAVCLGWEMLLMSLKYDYTGTLLYSKYKEFNIDAPIDLVGAVNSTKIWTPLSSTTRNNLQTKPYFFFDHTHGILEDNFTNSNISQFLKITSTSSPLNGGPDFVASAEGINKPIFGSQFHPEKLAYEWIAPASRDPEAIAISQNYINTFMAEARKNNRTFYNNQTLTQSLIYNFIPSSNSDSFSQVYTFPTVVQNKTAWPALFNSSTPSSVQAQHIQEPFNYFAPQDAKMLRGARI